MIPLLADEPPTSDVVHEVLLASSRAPLNVPDNDMAQLEIYYPFIRHLRMSERAIPRVLSGDEFCADLQRRERTSRTRILELADSVECNHASLLASLDPECSGSWAKSRNFNLEKVRESWFPEKLRACFTAVSESAHRLVGKESPATAREKPQQQHRDESCPNEHALLLQLTEQETAGLACR